MASKVAPPFAALLVALAPTARAATPPPPVPLRAEMIRDAPKIDGKLDDPAWAVAQPFSAFVEIYPREGARPARRTEVRVLHDDAWLYVGVSCGGERAEDIARPLGRRDFIPSGSDTVLVAIDSAHGRRTGYRFEVSAAGVMEDRLLFDDVQDTPDWDAVWDAAVSIERDGWTAELAIPFAALRFAASDSTTFGFYVERKVGRTHEVIASALIPLGANAFVSRFPDLLVGRVAPRQHLVLAPFAAARAVLHPPASGAPGPREADPVGDVGIDFSWPLSSALTLTGAVAPDFGQVEADPVILNLSRFEPFFPEKRPFFQRDLDLFQPVVSASGDFPQQLLYTRRIGAGAPILAAGKLTGDLAPGVQLGVLDAFVTGAAGRAGDRNVRFHREQPLHIAPDSSLPTAAPAPENFLAAVARIGSSRGSFASVTTALATPVAPQCTEAQDAQGVPPPQCNLRGGVSGAAAMALRTDDAAWGVLGQIAASSVIAGPPSTILTDGTELKRGDGGLGAYGTIGKIGGEPLRAYVGFEVSQPTLDLTFAGFQPDSNLEALRPEVRFVRAAGVGPFHEVNVGVRGALRRTADGRQLERGRGVHGDAKLVLPGYHEVDCDGGYEGEAYDVREIVGSGVAYLRPPFVDAGCTFFSDTHRAVAFELGGHGTWTQAAPPLPATAGWRAHALVAVRPHPRLETRVWGDLQREPIAGRFVAPGEGDDLLFGDISALSLSVSLRQLVVITPRLTLELYAQLFTDYGRFGAFYSGVPRPSDTIAPADLRRAAPPVTRPDFVQASLRVNTVLRWEYRPGSALYAVYQRTGDALLSNVVPSTARLAPDLLDQGTATDVFLVKIGFALER
jgi:hypothetical protein